MGFTTRKTLLEKVGAGDEVSWREFYEMYRPLVLLHGKDFELDDDELAELAQRVMGDLFSKNVLGKYDVNKVPDNLPYKYDGKYGRFRHYLRKIIRNHAVTMLRKRRYDLSVESRLEAGKDFIDEHEDAWEREWHAQLLEEAMRELKKRVKLETYVAFEMVTLQERDADEVAKFLNMSVSSVYTAKSRCKALLTEIVKRLEEK